MSELAERLHTIRTHLQTGALGQREVWEAWLTEAAAENERLTVENWQLKGALGYEVPGDIPCGDFKCGLCDAKTIEVNETRAENKRLRAIVDGQAKKIAELLPQSLDELQAHIYEQTEKIFRDKP